MIAYQSTASTGREHEDGFLSPLGRSCARDAPRSAMVGQAGSHPLMIGIRKSRVVLVWIALATTAAGLGACGGHTEALQARIDKLEERLRDAERQGGRIGVRIEDFEDRINIMSDRVETNRLALERRGHAKPLPMIVARPDGSGSVVTEDPVLSAPARLSEVRPAPRSDAGLRPRILVPDSALYEERLDDQPLEFAPEPLDERVESVVISEDEYQDFVRQYGVDRDDSVSDEGGEEHKPGRRAAGLSRPRNAQDPVTSETLPIVPINAEGGERGSEPMAERTAMEIYKSGLALYRAGDYAAALSEFESYLEKGPSQDYLDNAYYWLGESSFGLGQYQKAIGYFDRVIKEIPEGNKVPDSMLKASLAYAKIGQSDQAKSILYNLLETYPSTNAAKLATDKLNNIK